MKLLWNKLKESISSVLPISVIVLILNYTIAPLSNDVIYPFIAGSILLILGLSIFTLGVDIAFMPMSQKIGAYLTKSKKIFYLVVVTFVLGFFMTIAEPDLQVLARQVPAIPNQVLIISIAFGVGFLLVIAILRIIFRIPLAYLYMGLYGLIFLIAAFTSLDFIGLAFDSGGVTTGPITVPFIIALGIGVASVSSKNIQDDSFGIVAFGTIGPVFSILFLGLVYGSKSAVSDHIVINQINSFMDIIRVFAQGSIIYILEVIYALIPIVIFFIIFQVFFLKLTKSYFYRVMVGMIYTFIGLVLFLTAANIGFLPAGNLLGKELAALEYNYILIPLGLLIGMVAVIAEPTVHILTKQVEEITAGSISSKAMLVSLSIGVGLAVTFAMLRVFFSINIWFFILPGYIIAIILTFFAPKIFTAISFDSGTVSSGPMSVTFLLPFVSGVSETLGGNILTDAFGVVGLVTMMPVVTMQILGIIYKIKLNKINKKLNNIVHEDQNYLEFKEGLDNE